MSWTENSEAMDRRRGLPRLFVKYWWQLLTAVALPLVCAVAVGAWFAYETELSQIKRTQTVEALALATAVQATVQKEIGYMARLYGTSPPEEQVHRLGEEIEIALSNFPEILQVQVFRGGLERLYVSQLEPTREAAGMAPIKSSAGSGRLAPQRPQLSLAHVGPQQVPVIAVTIPSNRVNDEQLVFAIDLRAISDLLAQASRRELSRIYLLDGDARIIAHSEPGLSLSRRHMGNLIHVRKAYDFPAEASAGLALQSDDISGAPVLATMKTIPNTDWMVVIERPLEEVVAPIRRDLWRTLVLVALGLACAALLGVFLARQFTRPILGLGSDVERIGNGDLAHRTRISTGDEIEALGAQVNEMAARLEGYTMGLERQVAERTAALEAAMRARALFLAAASHDLRQPLYAISILADTLAAEPLGPECIEVVEKQREAIAALRTLFDNLLDLSRFDAGEVTPVIQSESLRKILGPVVREAEVVCKAKGLRFSMQLPEVNVVTDANLIRRALTNILSNAARYTPSGEVRLVATTDMSKIVVKVSDTGIGIAVPDQQRVFDEFVQLSNPGRDREKGVGLGLSIVKRICTLLRVPMTMSSVPGRGTSFSLFLPAAPEGYIEAPENSAPALLGQSFQGLRIWVIEDDKLVRDALARQFSAWGAIASFGGNAGEIQALYSKEGAWPDLIILDDMLGTSESGLEIATWMRTHLPERRILLVTGNVGSRLEALESSSFTVLKKPLSSAELAMAIYKATSEAPS